MTTGRTEEPREGIALPEWTGEVKERLQKRLGRVTRHLDVSSNPEWLDGLLRSLWSIYGGPEGKLISMRRTALPGRFLVNAQRSSEELDRLILNLVQEVHARPGSYRKAVELVTQGSTELVDRTFWIMYSIGTARRSSTELLIPDVPKGFLHSVMLRAADSFPWATSCAAGRMIHLVLLMLDTPPKGETLLGAFPPDAAPAPVARWAEGCKFLGMKHGESASVMATGFYTSLRRHEPTAPEGYQPGGGYLLASGFAALFLAKERVAQDRGKNRIAIDAGKPHHKMLMGMRDLPKDPKKKWEIEESSDEPGKVELLAPGAGIQMLLPMDGIDLHEATIKALHELAGNSGLRNWAALKSLFSVEGQRTGQLRWTLDSHMDALGYKNKRTREDPKMRARIAREVELLTRLELAVYDKKGRVRERRPILLATRFLDVKDERGRWLVEEIDIQVNPSLLLGGRESFGFQINPWLYSGVRDFDTGKMGQNWFPAPVELAHIDHERHPYAIALGLLLPIRWRLKLADKKNHLRISGEKLLALAGVKFNSRYASRTWDRVHKDMEVLKAKGGLGRYEWEGEPWTPKGICILHPADWMLDPWRGVHQIEAPPVPVVLTGKDLRGWRKREGLTQDQAGKVLGTSRDSVIRAEKKPEKVLTERVRLALARWMTRSPRGSAAPETTQPGA